jgi:hypothetical protein
MVVKITVFKIAEQHNEYILGDRMEQTIKQFT